MRAIVTFHSIDDTGSVLSFPQRALAQFLEALAASGISVCALEELLRTGAQRAVALAFDDGMQSVFRNALPVLKDFAVPAHLFLTVGAVGRPLSQRRSGSVGLNKKLNHLIFFDLECRQEETQDRSRIMTRRLLIPHSQA